MQKIFTSIMSSEEPDQFRWYFATMLLMLEIRGFNREKFYSLQNSTKCILEISCSFPRWSTAWLLDLRVDLKIFQIAIFPAAGD